MKAEAKAPPGALKKPKKWKAEHEQFIAALRAARGGGGGGKGGDDYVPAAPVIDPSLVQCPHCERRFNPTSAERRIFSFNFFKIFFRYFYYYFYIFLLLF